MLCGWKDGESGSGWRGEGSESESEEETEATSRGMKSSPALAGCWAWGSSFWALPVVVSMAMLMVLCGVAYDGRPLLVCNEPWEVWSQLHEWLLRNCPEDEVEVSLSALKRWSVIAISVRKQTGSNGLALRRICKLQYHVTASIHPF